MVPIRGERRRSRVTGLVVTAAALALLAAPAATAMIYEPAGESGVLDHGTGTTTVDVPTPVGDLEVTVEDHGLNGLLTGDPPSADPTFRSCLDGCGSTSTTRLTDPEPGAVPPTATKSPTEAGSAIGTGRGPTTRSVAQDRSRAPTRDAPRRATVSLALVAAAGAAAFVLYRRLTRDDLLDNDLRAAIVEIVTDDPGIHLTALADRLDVAPATVLYHVRLLAEFDLIVLDDAQRKTCCYTPEHGPEARKVQRLLRSRPRRDLLELVLETPGINLSEAARHLGKDRSTIKYHADRLEAGGLLETASDAGARHLTVPEELRDRLETG